MAQLLATSEEDSEQAASLLERLNKEKKVLTQECQQLKKKGVIIIISIMKTLLFVCSDQALQRRVVELDREKDRLERRSSGRMSSPEVGRVKKERDELVMAVERMEQELSQVTGGLCVHVYVFITVTRRVAEFNRRKRQH